MELEKIFSLLSDEQREEIKMNALKKIFGENFSEEKKFPEKNFSRLETQIDLKKNFDECDRTKKYFFEAIDEHAKKFFDDEKKISREKIGTVCQRLAHAFEETAANLRKVESIVNPVKKTYQSSIKGSRGPGNRKYFPVELHGRTFHKMEEIEEAYGCSRNMVYDRLSNEIEWKDIFPDPPIFPATLHGRHFQNAESLAKVYGISAKAVKLMINRSGYDIKEAFPEPPDSEKVSTLIKKTDSNGDQFVTVN